MRHLAIAVLAAAVLAAGCHKHKPADPPKDPVKTASTPKPNTDTGGDKTSETPKKTRKVLYPEKKGMLATYECHPCNPGKTWTQPAEEEKLCLDYCNGEMPECGRLVKEEAAPR